MLKQAKRNLCNIIFTKIVCRLSVIIAMSVHNRNTSKRYLNAKKATSLHTFVYMSGMYRSILMGTGSLMGRNPYAEPVGMEHEANVCFLIMILQPSSNGLYMSRMQANFEYTFHKSMYAMICQHSISHCQFYKTLLLKET